MIVDLDGDDERRMLKVNALPLAAGTSWESRTGGGGASRTRSSATRSGCARTCSTVRQPRGRRARLRASRAAGRLDRRRGGDRPPPGFRLMPTRVAVDIGGTFTDLVHLEAESGTVGAAKASTTPPLRGVACWRRSAEPHLDGVDFLGIWGDRDHPRHRWAEGAPSGADHDARLPRRARIQKANRPDLYNLLYRKPEPFVRRRLRLEVFGGSRTRARC